MNMRKIIAVLAAALMLCAAIPMGALSVVADGDVVIDYNFDDGVAHFERGYVENGYMVFDGTTAPWQNAYLYANAMKANTDYVATFSAKADKDADLGLKINNNWAGDTAEKYVSVTTEWQDFEIMFNTSELADLTSTAIVMFYSPYDAAGAPIYCIDNLKIVEYVEPAVPGTVINGDFETGDLSGWAVHQSTAISTDAHSGSYAANIKGNGGWGGMLNQDIPVEAGKTYKVSIWAKANANGANIQIQDGPAGTEVNLASKWFTDTEWTNIVWEVIPTTDVICINFCGGGNGIAEDVLVDDITVTEKVYGQVVNGDFSNGSEGWNLSGYASVVDGAIQLDNPTQWNESLTQVIDVEANTTYEITWKSKRISGNGAFNLIACQAVSPWGNLTRVDGQNWMNETSGEWVSNSFTVNSGDNTAMLLKFTTESAATPGVILLDDVVVTKVVAASDDGFIKNGDFETGKAEPEWTVYSGTAVSADAAKNGSYGLHITNPTGGWGGTAYQDFTVEVGKTYRVTMWAKNLDGARGQNIQIQNGGANVASKWFDNTFSWTQVTFEFTATDTNVRINICGGGTNANEELYVDDVQVVELIDPSFDGYIYNGDFETGELHPWDNLYGNNTVEIVEGMDGGYGLNVIAKKWNHVRQTGIAVEANTWYKVTVWAKTTNNMCVLVKDGADTTDIINNNFSAGEEWTEIVYYFNSGEYTTIILSLMGGDHDEDGDRIGTFDNIKIEKHEHTYELTDGTFASCETDGSEVYTCSLCGDSYTEVIPAYHNGNLEYNAAVEPTDCAHPGNIEHYYCPGCNEYFADANAGEMINPWYIDVTVDCVKPEGLADCADWTCEVCGNENYGSGEHDTGVPACQDGHCSKCDKDIAGYGHQNYDGPACLPGNCYYCGEAMEPVAHENGAWAPCLEGECSYGCGLTYPATAEHVDDDADGYCDTCWNHLAHVDEDANGECDLCWSPMPEEPEVVYGDANGDGEIDARDIALLQQHNAGWEVELNDAAADVNGDGEIDARDIALLQQHNAGWDVVLGPV